MSDANQCPGCATLRSRLAAIEALHQPFTPGFRVGDGKDVGTLCEHCTDTGDPYCVVSEEWPCPTIAAARGEVDRPLTQQEQDGLDYP